MFGENRKSRVKADNGDTALPYSQELELGKTIEQSLRHCQQPVTEKVPGEGQTTASKRRTNCFRHSRHIRHTTVI